MSKQHTMLAVAFCLNVRSGNKRQAEKLVKEAVIKAMKQIEKNKSIYDVDD